MTRRLGRRRELSEQRSAKKEKVQNEKPSGLRLRRRKSTQQARVAEVVDERGGSLEGIEDIEYGRERMIKSWHQRAQVMMEGAAAERESGGVLDERSSEMSKT